MSRVDTPPTIISDIVTYEDVHHGVGVGSIGTIPMGTDEKEEWHGARNQICHVVKNPVTFFLVNLTRGCLPISP